MQSSNPISYTGPPCPGNTGRTQNILTDSRSGNELVRNSKPYRAFLLFTFFLVLLFIQLSAPSNGQQEKALGRLFDGTKVFTVSYPDIGWVIKTRGASHASTITSRPVQLEFFDSIKGRKTKAYGYDEVENTSNGFNGKAIIHRPPDVTFRVNDRWEISGMELRLKREVVVTGNEENGGFMSALTLFTNEPWSRPDVDIFAPGMIYGGTENIRQTGPGGMRAYSEGRGIVMIREERFPVPLFCVRFADGSSLSLLNPEPRGGTTKEDALDISRRDVIKPLIDERFQFGSLGEDQTGSWRGDPNEPAGQSLIRNKKRFPALGYWFPGTEGELFAGFGPCNLMRRRFHPVRDGFNHRYQLAIRFGQNEEFPVLVENAWRWAWETVNPSPELQDIELLRTTLLDLLADNTIEAEGRAVMPFLANPTTGEIVADHRNGRMGFISRNVEGADLFLMESMRTEGKRSERFRILGLKIMDTFASLEYSPPEGVGLWVDNGKPTEGLVFLRLLTEDLFYMLSAWERENALGYQHPLWLQRCKEFGDWLLLQQDREGGFPRAWKPKTNEVVMPSTLNSYNAMAFLTKLSEVTGESKYLDAAIRAGELSWKQGQRYGEFVGGTPDNPNVIDKEAAVLSMHGYLMLYEATGEHKWLDRAKMAGIFGETWIYLWDIPIPSDIQDEYLRWKHGVSTVGQQLIATGHSGADSWMSRDVLNYIKLYQYTENKHFLEVAIILLHNTKNMIALPGKLYDFAGPGWQDEAWGFVAPAPRFPGTRRVWLPWLSINHLRGIFDLENYDAALFKTLCSGN